MEIEPNNKIYFGDNLEIMKKHIPDESIDLIYLDPPFNSKRAYNSKHLMIHGAGQKKYKKTMNI